MNEMKRLLSFVRRAVDDYDLIDEGDKIAVGVSGGTTDGLDQSRLRAEKKCRQWWILRQVRYKPTERA